METLHEPDLLHHCDFTPIYPSVDTPKPIFYRHLKPPYVAELIRNLVISQDKFYNTKIRCRRRFSFNNGTVKYYPDLKETPNRQMSFLHHNIRMKHTGDTLFENQIKNLDLQKNIKTSLKNFNRSFSLYEFDMGRNFREESFQPAVVPKKQVSFLNQNNDMFLTRNFILAEKSFICCETGDVRNSKNNSNKQKNTESGKVVLRERKTKMGVGIKRMSLPLMKSNSVSW